jgi:Holliday junction resolvase RusA-like endonuclease
MKKEAVQIGYPNAVISVNHYLGKRKGGGFYVKPEAKAWQEELGWIIKHLHLEDWTLPLEIKCDGYFTSLSRTPDLSNLSKCTLDAIEEVTGINDVNFRWRDGTITIVPKEPHLIFTISENPSNPLPEATKSKSRRVKA